MKYGLILFLGMILLTLAGCESIGDYQLPVFEVFSNKASVAKNPKKPGDYLVKRGDTLYSIAWANNLDYRTLADMNHLKAPYKIYAGQYLKTRAGFLHSLSSLFIKNKPAQSTKWAKRQTAKLSRIMVFRPNASKEAGRYEIIRPSKAKISTKYYAMPSTPLKSIPVKGWKWPSEGKIVQGFTERAGGNKGIDFTGSYGAPVYAAASGKVVYKGSGLKGYGQLLLIKHNNSFLSAYAHNKRLLVQEGQRVVIGQKIAEMGRANHGQVRLHFEIRKNGQPINPMIYLNAAL